MSLPCPRAFLIGLNYLYMLWDVATNKSDMIGDIKIIDCKGAECQQTGPDRQSFPVLESPNHRRTSFVIQLILCYPYSK